jgi:hypothetical protein
MKSAHLAVMNLALAAILYPEPLLWFGSLFRKHFRATK